MFSLSMFGPFRSSVFRCSVHFEVRSCDIQSFDVRSHSTFSLSMFGPIRGSVFRCSVLFDIRSFDVWSFDIQSFEVRSFEVRSFEVRSRFCFFCCKNVIIVLSAVAQYIQYIVHYLFFCISIHGLFCSLFC